MECRSHNFPIHLFFLTVWSLFLPVEAIPQTTASEVEPFHIAVFTPTTEGNTYWPEVYRVMRSAETRLNVELAFHSFDVGDRFAKPDEGVKLLHTEPRPDGAIFSVAYGQAEALMNAAEERGIPFFLHGPLFPRELAALGGGPRRTYRNWIGYFHEDEEEKGYLLARELIAAAAQTHNGTASEGKIRIVGVSGDATWYGTSLREAGLSRAVEEDPRARLLQIVPTRWTQQEGQDMTRRLLSRYTDVAVVWCASDQLALGAVEALRAADRNPGEDTFAGGLDLSSGGVEAVGEGTLTATVASPISMWTRVLGYLSEYLHSRDFADQMGTVLLFPPVVATEATVDTITGMQEW
jgi:ABC-type sugar transport system substrate-binding protein